MTYESLHFRIRNLETLELVQVLFLFQQACKLQTIKKNYYKQFKKFKNKDKVYLGGTCFVLGSSCFPLPRPYNGTTFSLLIAALHTGHSCLVGLVSNH